MTQPATGLPSLRAQPAGAPPSRLRLVPAASLRPPRAPFVALVVGLLGAGLVGLLLLNTAIAENSFRLHALQQRTNALDLQEQQLQRDIDNREAPGQLAARAHDLGMVPAGNPAFIRLRDGKILGVPTPARAPVRPAAPRPSPSAAASPAPTTAGATASPAPAVAPSPAVHR